MKDWLLVIGFIVLSPVFILLLMVIYELLVNIYQFLEMFLPDWFNPVSFVVLLIVILILML